MRTNDAFNKDERKETKEVQCKYCQTRYKLRGDARMRYATLAQWTCPNCKQQNTTPFA